MLTTPEQEQIGKDNFDAAVGSVRRRDFLVGAAAAGWNRHSISIGFIGKFMVEPPDYDALDAAQQFLQYMAYQGTPCVC